MDGVLRSATRPVAWLAILVLSAALVVAVLVPRISGATPYTVLTGSMSPGLPPGTLVVVKPAPIEEIRIGDVITYQIASGEPAVVTHRVVGVGTDARGERVLQLRGDGNAAPDRGSVRAVQIRGALWYSVPYLGHVNNVLTARERQWAVHAVAVFLLAYAAAMLGGDLRERRRRPPGVVEEAPAVAPDDLVEVGRG